MRSSISSSERRAAHRAIAVLLALLVLYFVALETAMRTVIPRLSNSARREHQDYDAALRLRSTANSRSVLLIGNSLLLHGIDRQTLQQAIGPSYTSTFLPMENTSFWDWYFGLRRLFDEGSRPSVVVLSINVRQLASDSTNGEQFAHAMMKRADLLRVAQAAHLDNTTASGYFFASFSGWLGGRVGLRNWILDHWLPGADLLVESFTPVGQAGFPQDIVESRALPRLTELRDLCRSHGAEFIYVVPATSNEADPSLALQTAAARADVKVLAPYPPGEMPAEGYSDGFHLNEQGADWFTERLGPILLKTLGGAESASAGG